jgi:CzcA family heavy metal efflux pump
MLLNAIIRFSLKQRLLVLTLACLVVAAGYHQASQTAVDVFPDLNRPRVVIMTEAHGMSPEEVESAISLPLELAFSGANGVETVRSTSGVGISVIYVEFDWDTDPFTNRQIVSERLQTVRDHLPTGINPTIAPMSSIMGQVMMVGIWSDQSISDPLELRTLADWVVRPRFLTVPGVAQVFTMGGGRKQFQVLADPDQMLKFNITLQDIETAIRNCNQNTTGGYLDDQGPQELLVRAIGRIKSLDDLKNVVIKTNGERSVSVQQVATVKEAAQTKRGDSAAYQRLPNGRFSGGDAIILTINKQPSADTRAIASEIESVIGELRETLPPSLKIAALYSQKSFIDRAIANVVEALRDGGILVVLILFLFLFNFRTTLITLVAIPLSIASTLVVFSLLGLSINTMTLGGLAVAIGELVDDAIVDVENIFRRLKENRKAESPRPTLTVVYEASREIRTSIVFGTMIVTVVFIPLFALEGMEGRIFAPLGVAYIVSILSSLLVSLTITPVLSYWLLGLNSKEKRESDSFVLRVFKYFIAPMIRISLRIPVVILAFTLGGVCVAGWSLSKMDRDFLPPFNEGAIQLNVILPPGTSLSATNKIAKTVEKRLCEIADVQQFMRRTGRAELDEHAEGVHMSEYIIELDASSPNTRESQLDEIRNAMAEIPGIVTAVEQPIAHLISHMLSGVKAQIGIKIFGDDLGVLRRKADQIKQTLETVPGVTDLLVEPQVNIPQLRIELDRDQLLRHGLSVVEVNQLIETGMNGTVVSQVIEGQRNFDLVVRFREDFREDIDRLGRISIQTSSGYRVPLESVATIYHSSGPNTINREDSRRRVVIQCNVAGRGVVDVVQDIQSELKILTNDLPAGYFIQYSGQFESQQSASRRIAILFALSMFGVFLLLYTMFRSVNLSIQVLMALPMAFIGSVIALKVTDQSLTIAAMVGFISLGGIASRNGILLINHYLHLVQHEGAQWDKKMIVQAGLDRVAPVLMTAMTSGFGLVPLVLAAGVPGKEILYPIATVIVGGLVSSTLLDFLVHPAMFWLFGIKSAKHAIAHQQTASILDD